MFGKNLVTLALGVLTSCVPVDKNDFPHFQEKRIPISQLAGKIIDFHEARTGVSYLQNYVPIYFDANMDYNGVARYSVSEEAIYLHPRYEKQDLSKLLENLDREDITKEEMELREVLSHEIAHFLTDIYISKYVPDSWLAGSFERNFPAGPENLDIYMISEGIAEYFGHLFKTNDETRFATYRWTADFEESEFRKKSFFGWITYMGGRDIVEPILKENTHEGLIWLLRNELVLEPPNMKPVLLYKEKGIERK